MITLVAMVGVKGYPNEKYSHFPDIAQEGKNDLVLPALRFELELFSSRTGSPATISTQSTHQACSW